MKNSLKISILLIVMLLSKSSFSCDGLSTSIISNNYIGNGEYLLTIEICESVTNSDGIFGSAPTSWASIYGILININGVNIISVNTPSITGITQGNTIFYTQTGPNSIEYGDWGNSSAPILLDYGDPMECWTFEFIVDGPATTVDVSSSTYDGALQPGAGMTLSNGIWGCGEGTSIPPPSCDASWSPPTICSGSVSLIDLTTTTTTSGLGTFTGTGVDSNNGLFNPTGLTSNVSVTFTVDDGGYACSTTQDIVIIDLLPPNLTDQTICAGDAVNLDATINTTSGCSYTLVLDDNYGDGWNGADCDIFINGILYAIDQTVPSCGGSGNVPCQTTISIPVNDGDVILLNYSGGSFDSENTISLYDDQMILINSISNPPDGNLGTGITANCSAAVIDYVWSPTTGLSDPNIANPIATPGTTTVYTVDISSVDLACVTQASVTITVDPCVDCLISNFTANIGACGSSTYTTTGQIEFTDAPDTGQLIIEDCDGFQHVFNAPFVSPTNYSITGQTPNGLGCDITAYFTDAPLCTQVIPYVAPLCPCNMDSLNVTQGLCDPATDTYGYVGDLGFTFAPTGGQLIISADNGITTYDTIILPPFVSPYNWSISGIPSDGSTYNITAYFSDDIGCSLTVGPITAPTTCACVVDIGTFTDGITGSSTNNYVLCHGDEINIDPNGDLTPPGEQFTTPPQTAPPVYNPGVWWLLYSCPPTVAVSPDPVLLPWVDDPCFIDAYNSQSLNDLNNPGIIGSYPPGTFVDNTVYWVPITMYSMSTGTVSFVTGGVLPCYEMGPVYPVQHLPEFFSFDVDDCLAGTSTITVNGGLPEIDGSNFTASNLLPATASFTNTTTGDFGTIEIAGLQGGDIWSFTITDGNGCPYLINGGPFPFSEDPGFSYVPSSWCTVDPVSSPIITGVSGGAFIATPAGLTINSTTGEITPSTSTPGVYSVTYTTPGVCFDDSTFVVTVTATPFVDPILDQTVCDGANFTEIIFTGAAGSAFNWVNDNINTGLQNPGNGNINAFTATAPIVQEISNVIVTPTSGGCTGQSESFVLTVNPMEDPSFNYLNGLTYCQSGTNPAGNITGTQGGVFSYVAITGGPSLSLDVTTGDVVLVTSNLGTYEITYTTSGVCSQSSTLTMVITDNLVAEFSFGMYCANNTDPIPNYIQDDSGVLFSLPGSGGIFTALPVGLAINSTTGVVDLDASIPGTYNVTNTIPASVDCPSASYVDDITIFEIPDANIIGSTTICASDPLPDIDINITANASNWSVTYNMDGNPIVVNTSVTPFTIVGADFGTYELVSIVDANGCENSISGQVIVDTFPTPTVDPLIDQSICEGDNLLVQLFSGSPTSVTFQWENVGNDIGFGMVGNGQIGSFLATAGQADMIVTPYGANVTPSSPFGCVGSSESFSIIVVPNPVPAFVADTLIGCEPFLVTFTNLTPNSFNCIWDFGDGNTTNDCGSVTNTYNSGTYDVALTVSTLEGCSASFSAVDYIEVFSLPVATFGFMPHQITVEDPFVEFDNSSFNADSYVWDFGDNSPTSNVESPTHQYPSVPGEYLVTLWAYNYEQMCADMYQQLIVIQDVLIYYVPNVFTPDGDEFNQTFQPIFTSGFDQFDYHLTIFNRWGEIIFESYDATIGWNGRYGDSELVQDGVYIWQIEFKETMSDKRHLKRGHVTVLK